MPSKCPEKVETKTRVERLILWIRPTPTAVYELKAFKSQGKGGLA
jgi:hypothetical protein